jgi:hypothetical protein
MRSHYWLVSYTWGTSSSATLSTTFPELADMEWLVVKRAWRGAAGLVA